ncbi:isoprenyl transferase [Salinibacterium sp. UTAS2018]|uniref:isoprenyl transferase n=1 Tax=unclassified Salinibacterium TaxID=2632331 RepID=UPI0010093D8F|nr:MULTISPECIES: isoprenyl transferase [unclassified Salinibacterium]MBH0010144.1 isoprenyl transferase [Salinibacterium sp. SWN1162]QAV71322.1 isoprenyl transferase [Salinibacterium sp. UTAS2018]
MSKRQSPFGRGFLYGLYQKKLRRQLEGQQLPRHVAMIIDGNRRWAKLKDLETAAHGHRAGAAKYREFLVWCDDLDISVATLYLLSTDNLTGRSPEELTELFTIIGDLAEDLSHFRDWRVQHVGSDAGLPDQLKAQLTAAHDRTATNTGLHVNLAIGYGGRHEIAEAMRRIVRKHSAEGHSLEALAELLTPELIGEHLYTKGQPDPDLVIRTSGEQRISDFMLWQSAHSELYFMEALGPDLREVDFLRALRDFSRRNRRFGA